MPLPTAPTELGTILATTDTVAPTKTEASAEPGETLEALRARIGVTL